MSLDFTAPPPGPAETALRGQVRAFLGEALAGMPPEQRARSWQGWDAGFSRALGARGWLGMCWPREHGGQGRGALERFVVLEELLAAGAPVAAHWIAERQTGPLLLKYGTPAQQALLPGIAAGELFTCIGMSEPGAGSDLAAVATRARRTADGWRVTGEKLWTTHAHHAHYMVLFCRTGEHGADRAAGTSQLLVPMDSPGITVTPIIDMAGDHHFNSVAFDDVALPHDALIGQEGQGWAQVMAELAHERSGPERFLSAQVLLAELVAALGPDQPAPVAATVGAAVADLMVLRQMSRAVARRLDAGEDPALAAAIVKDLGAAHEQSIPDLVRALMPPDPPHRLLATLNATLLIAPAFSLRGGTREILRGIIARGLGLR